MLDLFNKRVAHSWILLGGKVNIKWDTLMGKSQSEPVVWKLRFQSASHVVWNRPQPTMLFTGYQAKGRSSGVPGSINDTAAIARSGGLAIAQANRNVSGDSNPTLPVVQDSPKWRGQPASVDRSAPVFELDSLRSKNLPDYADSLHFPCTITVVKHDHELVAA